MTKTHKNAADTFIRISSCISQMGTSEYMDIDRFLNKVLSKVNLLTGRNLKNDQNLRKISRKSSSGGSD